MFFLYLYIYSSLSIYTSIYLFTYLSSLLPFFFLSISLFLPLFLSLSFSFFCLFLFSCRSRASRDCTDSIVKALAEAIHSSPANQDARHPINQFRPLQCHRWTCDAIHHQLPTNATRRSPIRSQITNSNYITSPLQPIQHTHIHTHGAIVLNVACSIRFTGWHMADKWTQSIGMRCDAIECHVNRCIHIECSREMAFSGQSSLK